MKRALLIAVLALACRKSTPDAAADAAPAPTTPATLVTASDPYPAPPPANPEGLATGEPVKPIEEVVTEDAGQAPQAPVDPFPAVIGQVQGAGLGCFKGMPPGEYTATIEVVVLPSGTASRAEVVAGPADAGVRKCLEQAASRKWPASQDGRKLKFDVQVKG